MQKCTERKKVVGIFFSFQNFYEFESGMGII